MGRSPHCLHGLLLLALCGCSGASVDAPMASLDIVDVAPPTPAPQPAPSPLDVPVVPRGVWGADLKPDVFREHTISKITVHHTAVASAVDTDGRQRARAHTRSHLQRGWPDLAYHFLIDGHGVVREGRPVGAIGDTGTDYDPTGHLLVTLEGNFEEHTPTDAQLDTAAQVLAWGSATFGVPVEAIDGHKDHASTACPGESLYGLIASGDLGRRVRAVLDAGGARLEAQDCVVAVDVGHSAERPGATSARGVPEHTFNRRFAEELVVALGRAADVDGAFLLDPDDVGLPLKRRAPLAAERDATLFLSVHHDSVQPRYLEAWQVNGVDRPFADAFRGHSLFVSSGGEDPAGSERLGRSLGRALRGAGLVPTAHHAEAIEGENRPWVDAELGLYRYDGLAVLRLARMPAVLVEAGVILHREEEAELATTEGRARRISALVAGVSSYCVSAAGPSGSPAP